MSKKQVAVVKKSSFPTNIYVLREYGTARIVPQANLASFAGRAIAVYIIKAVKKVKVVVE